MSKIISLKIDTDILLETEQIIRRLCKSRNAYINEAVNHYNKVNKKRHMKDMLVKESTMVYASSMETLKEMEALEDGIDTRGNADADT